MVGTNPNDGVRKGEEVNLPEDLVGGNDQHGEQLASAIPVELVPEIDRDYLLSRFVDVGLEREDVEALLDQYVNYPLTLPVTDQPMRRISEVLTDRGFITTDTCDGHGNLSLIHI